MAAGVAVASAVSTSFGARDHGRRSLPPCLRAVRSSHPDAGGRRCLLVMALLRKQDSRRVPTGSCPKPTASCGPFVGAQVVRPARNRTPAAASSGTDRRSAKQLRHQRRSWPLMIAAPASRSC